MTNNNRKRIRRFHDDNPATPLGRPTYNQNYILSQRQRETIVAILLTDGWISHPPANRNPLVGFQNSHKNKPLVLFLMVVLKDLIRQQEPTPRHRGAPGSKDRLFLQWTFRTVAHPQLLQFEVAFGGAGTQKSVPRLSYFMQMLTWESVAIILMCDGSRKGDGRGMEIHLQSFHSKEALGRLCLALYFKFGVKAYPSYYGPSLDGSQIQYHIQVSGFSLAILRAKALPYTLIEFHYKYPSLRNRLIRNTRQSGWWRWYREAKNANWHEQIFE